MSHTPPAQHMSDCPTCDALEIPPDVRESLRSILLTPAAQDNVHYEIKDGEIARSESTGGVLPYMLQRDGKDFLCVMEGDAYHQYEVSKVQIARLAAECGARLWAMEQNQCSA